MEYFQLHLKQDWQCGPVVDWVEEQYLKLYGKKPRDTWRAIRRLYQEGKLIKVRKGVYRYDPDYVRSVSLLDFPPDMKEKIFQRDKYRCVICGLARILRSLVVPALENIPTWHERDLTQTSAERFIIPEACILTDYILALMTNILTNLQVDEKRMLKNIELSQGRTMSEAVMLALTRKGMSRQEAHELMRTLTIRSESEGQPFKETLLKNDTVRKMLSEKEIDEALDPRNYLGTAIKQVELVVQKTKQKRKIKS